MSYVHCLFCGGKECKFEKWRLWTSDPTHPNAIDGLYSNWITNTIMARARPSSRLIKEFKLVEAFKENDIGSIINLQEAGEHEQCGDGIEVQSGFAYLPEVWMNANRE